MPSEHYLGTEYQAVISNQLLSMLDPNKTPKLIISKEKFNELIHHKDAYVLNAKRSITFMELENKLHESLKNVSQNYLFKKALDRCNEYAHEILIS